jgi:hypothetical protein
VLGEHSVMTAFLKLSEDEIKLLAQGVGKGKEVRDVISRLRKVMKSGNFSNYFVACDCCSPTDTERFAAKRGAVHSADSAWFFLAASAKVRAAAAEGKVEYLTVRPFVRIDRTREFRLFIKDGELKAMSQYNLVRHFRRLEGIKDRLWQAVCKWYGRIAEQLPKKDLTIDIYIENNDRDVKIMDLNPWGGDTDPLLLRTFDQDWNSVQGIKLMLPPTKISGDVEVSF